jgi:hypothetical protein
VTTRFLSYSLLAEHLDAQHFILAARNGPYTPFSYPLFEKFISYGLQAIAKAAINGHSTVVKFLLRFETDYAVSDSWALTEAAQANQNETTIDV